MKKILIAAYYFPPCNIVAANRAASFANDFARHGLRPVVVTRHWTGDENSTAGYESENLTAPAITEFENYDLIQLPYRAALDKFYHRALLKSRAAKLLLYAALYANGDVNPKCDAFEFHGFLREYLSRNPVDYIFATAFPMNTIKLGHSLAIEFDVPLIADFRDLWDNNLLANNYKPALPIRLQNRFYEFYLRRWLRPARLVTSVSQPLIDRLKPLAAHAESLVVTNGFESELFARASNEIAAPTDKFVFSVIGTLKPEQDLSVMLDGLKIFLENKNLSEIRLNFIGTNEFPAVAKMLENHLPSVCTTITDRIARRAAIERMCASHVLFYAGWLGFSGVASGKIYEYLGARRNILIAPNDRDVLEKIVSQTNAGKLADSAEQFADIMNGWFAEWKSNGKIRYRGIETEIENYTREKQAEKLAREILKIK